MSTIPPSAAYQSYSRLTPPDGKGPNGAEVLSNWLGKELLTVQRTLAGVQRFTKTVTAAYTLLTTDDVLLVDATSGPVTITWPDPTRAQHFTCTVKKIDATANAVTFASTIASTSTAATFDGVTSPTLVSQWDSKTERSNGVQYYQKDMGVTAIWTGKVPAANVTSGTFGSASGDTSTYKFTTGVYGGIQNKPTGIGTSLETGANQFVWYGDGNSATTAAGIRLSDIAQGANFLGFRSNGTAASPTAIVSGNTIGQIGWSGYDGTNWTITGQATMLAAATQNWNSTSRGSKLTFNTTPNGSLTPTTALTLDQDQSATFAGAIVGNSTITSGAGSGLAGGFGSLIGLGNSGSFPTLANGNGTLYGNSTLGAVLAGKGSSFDLYLGNSGGSAVMTVATGTVNALFGGAVTGGAASFTTGAFSGAVTLTPSTGTNASYVSHVTTGGTYYIGVDNSAGGFTGDAYALMVFAAATRDIQLLAGAGAGTFKLAATGGATFGGAVSMGALTATTGTFSGGAHITGGSFASGWIGGANGMIFGGIAGASNDFNWLNSAGSAVMHVPTGGTTLVIDAELQLPHAYVAGVVVSTGTIAIKDSTGTTYNVLVHT